MIDVGAPAEEVGVLLELNVPKSFGGRSATKYYMQAIACLGCQAILVGKVWRRLACSKAQK